jgi:hypothetical protein
MENNNNNKEKEQTQKLHDEITSIPTKPTV